MNTLLEFAQFNESIETVAPTFKVKLFQKAFDECNNKPVLIKILNLDLDPNNIAKKKAIKWIANAYGVYEDEIEIFSSMYGDLADGVHNFDGYMEGESKVSLNQLLRLLTLDCSRSDGNVFRLFEESFTNMNSLEKKWFIRYWLRKPRNGFQNKNLVKAVSEYYNKDIKKMEVDIRALPLDEVILFYENKVDVPNTLGFGNFIKPMLAKALPKDKWPNNNYVVEYKYDGNRYQVHRKDDRVIIFNRKGKDATDQFPDVVQQILESKLPNEFIVDGEIYPIKEDGTPEKHQKLGTRVHSKDKMDAVQKCPVKFVIFDMLQTDGESFMDEPLYNRLSKWEYNYGPFPTHRIWSENTDEMGVMGFYHSAIQDGFEGIIIKPTDALYQPGKRSKDWIKYKPPLIELDVVITGARYGDGKRANVFGSFDISVKHENEFIQIGSVGTGFSDTDLFRLTNELRKVIISSEKDTYLFLPRVVLEVTGDVVTRNEDETYALRFPRCKRIRNDKPVADIDTYEDMIRRYA